MNGRCTTHNRELKHSTKAECCCSMGQAWGPRCERCPYKYSPEYQELCLDSGFTSDGQGNRSMYINVVVITINLQTLMSVPQCQICVKMVDVLTHLVHTDAFVIGATRRIPVVYSALVTQNLILVVSFC